MHKRDYGNEYIIPRRPSSANSTGRSTSARKNRPTVPMQNQNQTNQNTQLPYSAGNVPPLDIESHKAYSR